MLRLVSDGKLWKPASFEDGAELEIEVEAVVTAGVTPLAVGLVPDTRETDVGAAIAEFEPTGTPPPTLTFAVALALLTAAAAAAAAALALSGGDRAFLHGNGP